MIGTGTPANQTINPPGWLDGRQISKGGAGQARSHLLAKNLGGSGDVKSNLVTFLHNPTNNSDMKTFENKTVKYIKDTKNSVYYQVTPLYNGTDGQPYGVIMEAVSANGDDFNERVRIIENPEAEAQAQAREKGTCSKEI